MKRVFATVGALLILACNHLPPNVTPVGGAAVRTTQLVLAIDTIGDVAVKAEAAGLIEHKDTLKVADACEKSARAAADLGRALQAGEGAASAKEKAVAIIRAALTQLPGDLSPGASEKIAPYINVALAVLNLLG